MNREDREKQIAILRFKLAEVRQGWLPQAGLEEPWQREMTSHDRERIWAGSLTAPQIVARIETCIAELEAEAITDPEPRAAGLLVLNQAVLQEGAATPILERLRVDCNLTYQQLADETGTLDEKAVSDHCKGKRGMRLATAHIYKQVFQRLGKTVEVADLLPKKTPA